MPTSHLKQLRDLVSDSMSIDLGSSTIIIAVRGRGIVVMTSRSFDGEYIARFIQRFGYGAARGSSTRPRMRLPGARRAWRQATAARSRSLM